MLKTEINLEMLIKSYVRSSGKNGIFISVLEADNNLAEALNMSRVELTELFYKYLYLTDFSNSDEMYSLFDRIKEESQPEAQYMILVEDGEIVKEYPIY